MRLNIEPVGCESSETMRRQAEQNAARGLPLVSRAEPHGRPLALVGGGPSVADHIDELRSWNPVDVWGINGTAAWLNSKGIPATMISVDPQDCLTPLTVGVPRALIASVCHPSAFDALGDKARIFHTEHYPSDDAIHGGSTTATRAHLVAMRLGYREINLFGCEGSFTEVSHCFKSECDPKQVIVRAGEKTYRTSLAFLNQTENLAALVREFPELFRDRSGGLLSAILANWDTWGIVALSEQLKNVLDPTAQPYTGQMPA